jgi:hypothetical protein
MPYDDDGADAPSTPPEDICYAVELLRGWIGERHPALLPSVREDQAAALRELLELMVRVRPVDLRLSRAPQAERTGLYVDRIALASGDRWSGGSGPGMKGRAYN